MLAFGLYSSKTGEEEFLNVKKKKQNLQIRISNKWKIDAN